MKKIKFFLSLMFSFVALAAYAQTATVKGTVKDSSNGDAIPSASVLVKGGDAINGVATDLDGKFSINVPANAILVVSSIGYQTKEIAASSLKDKTVIFLDTDSEFIEGAVKVGYGSSKKIGNQVGAIATVKSDIVKNSVSQSALDLLQGQVAGMQVLSSGGVAGDNSISMKIHGVGSLSNSSEPLFIIDGVQSSSTMVMNLNPNDILSITVLKDASSTSVYGSLGANGVVYVTTKGGRFDEKATVTIHSQWGLSTLANRQLYENMMSGDELKSFWIRSGIMSPSAIEGTYTSNGYDANTKWHKYFQNLKGLQYQNDVTIEGGSQKVAYMLSGSQFHQDGSTIGNYYDRYTLRSNIQARPTEWLKAGANITGYLTKDRQNGNWGNSSENSPYISGGLSYLLNPLYPAIDPETGEEYPEQYPNGFTNPHYFMSKFQDNYNRYGVNGSVFVEIEPYKGLILASRLGTDSYIDKRNAIIYPSAKFTNNSQRLLGDYFSAKNTITNTIEYSTVIKNAHEFSVLLGHEGIGYLYKTHSSSSEGQTDDRLMNIQNGLQNTYSMTQSKSEYAFLSFFAHADYNYQGKYFVDGTFRYDASSRFGKNNRWAPFWAVGAMWKISHEDFLKGSSIVNDLSLKVSYGTQGNANVGNYTHLGQIASSTSKYDGQSYLYLGSPSNENLTWEKQKLFTMTISGRFWNMLDAEVTVYQRKTTDMLMSVPQPYTTGFSSVSANVGAMQNTGCDITLGVDILKGKDYGLNFHTTFNYNAEKITELFDGRKRWEIANTGVAYVIGKPVMYYYPIFAGIDPEDGAPTWYLPGEDKDVCTMDPERTTKVFNEEELIQSTNLKRHEPVSGGFGIRGNWKGLSLNIDFSYFCGKYLINNDAFFYANPNMNIGYNQIKTVSDFWTSYNTDAIYPDWSKGYNMEFDTHILENASFLRLKNIRIGYALPKKAFGKQNVVKGVQFTFTGRNVWTATKYTGLDPEMDSNLTLGIPGNTLQVLGGVEIRF